MQPVAPLPSLRVHPAASSAATFLRGAGRVTGGCAPCDAGDRRKSRVGGERRAPCRTSGQMLQQVGNGGVVEG